MNSEHTLEAVGFHKPALGLVTTHACHYCEDAYADLLARAVRGEITLQTWTATSSTGQRLLSEHRPSLFPLILLDGEFFSAGRLSVRKLERALALHEAA